MSVIRTVTACSHCSSTPPAADARCPACGMWFVRPAAVFEHVTAPWHAPKRPTCRCPHCMEMLRDRNDPRALPFAFVLFLAAIVAARNLLPPGAALPAQGIVIAAWLATLAQYRELGRPAAERYAGGDD